MEFIPENKIDLLRLDLKNELTQSIDDVLEQDRVYNNLVDVDFTYTSDEKDLLKKKISFFIDHIENDALNIFKNLNFDKKTFLLFIFSDFIDDAYFLNEDGIYPKKELDKVDKEYIEKRLIYKDYIGYNHKDLRERKQNNPIPTIEELKMGCFIEQIEPQVRDAVMILRKKGYDTVESGFDDLNKWDQFFHIKNVKKENINKNKFEEIRSTIKGKYKMDLGIIFSEGDEVYINITPDKDLGIVNMHDFKIVLDDVANMIPSISHKTDFAEKGETIYFVENILKSIDKDKMLEQCKTDNDINLIESLYEAKGDREKVLKIMNFDKNHWIDY